jgi:predicted MFS family arabinose efflux permease
MRQLKGLVPIILIGVMGNSVIYLIPLLVGGMVSDRGFSEQQAGFMASADLGGYAVATFLTALILDRFSWRRMAIGALVVMLIANVATTFIYRPDSFALIRFASGLGSGVLAAIASVSVGQTDNPERNYGLLIGAALLFGTAGLWGLPSLLDRFGLNSAYWLLAVLAALVFLLAIRIPNGRVTRGQTNVAAPRSIWLWSGVVLLAILLFWAEQNDVYAYIERIGNAAGIKPEFIGFSLGVANLMGFVGASLVAWLGTRMGRLVPLVVATLLQLACLVVLMGNLSPMTYLVGLGVLALAWNIANPFQLGVLAGIDPSGRALALATTVTGAGLALGPAMAAVAIGVGGYSAVLWSGGALAVLSLALVLPPERAVARQLRAGWVKGLVVASPPDTV